MKAFLILLLIGFTFSYNCKKIHITTSYPGQYSKGSCTCTLEEMIGLSDTYLKKCNCFFSEEIQECRDDDKCQTNYISGCVNKDIRDYGKN